MTRFGGNEAAGGEPRLVARRMLRVFGLALAMLGPTAAVSSAQTTPAAKPPHAHVYLLRGAFNIFSLGMDEMAEKLQRYGIYATVNNHILWSSLADEAAAEYKSGRTKTIIIVGHSSGATAVTDMAARLGELGVPVKLAIGLDPTSREVASGHVDRYINYYIANGLGAPVIRGKGFSGVLQNVDVEKDPELGHFNIDKNQALQQRVISEIRAAAL
jgi:hypothetical protein